MSGLKDSIHSLRHITKSSKRENPKPRSGYNLHHDGHPPSSSRSLLASDSTKKNHEKVERDTTKWSADVTSQAKANQSVARNSESN
jgi:hypothetical protein